MEDWPMQEPPEQKPPDAPPVASIASLRSAFAHRARMEQRLYDAIERAADALPGFDDEHYGALARAMQPLAVGLGSRSILALMAELRSAARRPRWRQKIARLLSEERADAAAALELGEALERALERGRVDDVGAMAYLMRGVVVNRRRHLDWALEVAAEDEQEPPLRIEPCQLNRALKPYEEISEALRVLYPAS